MRKWIIPYIALFTMYGFVGYFSFGYDDEFFNIFEIERLGIKILHLVQSSDVHPPGSYLLNWILFVIFQKWEFVRLFISLISALSIVYAIDSVRQRTGDFAGLIAFLLLGLNPSLLLWCTSLRWYAFFTPLLIWLSFTPKRTGWRYWIKCFGGLLILGYIGYAMLIIALPLFYIYWRENKENIKDKILGLIAPATLFLILYSYQLYIFLTVHLKNGDNQMSSLFKSIIGIYVSQIGNQGVFPFSIFGIFSSIGTILIILLIVVKNRESNFRNSYFIAYILAILLSIASGIAGKFRNLVIITPWLSLLISTSFTSKQKKRFFTLFLLFVTIGNVGGIYNVISHSNTLKNKWNLPIKEIVSYSKEKKDQYHDVIIICHDYAISWALEKEGFKVLGPYTSVLLNKKTITESHKCVIFLKTFSGDELIQPKYPQMLCEIEEIEYDSCSNFALKKDDFFKYKKIIEPQYPEYTIYGRTFINVHNLNCLKSWQPYHFYKVEKRP